MKFLVWSLNMPVPLRKAPRAGVLKSTLSHLWRVYSTPSPAGKEVLTLLSLCFIISIVTGGLLYRWLSATLRYDERAAVTTAGVYGTVILFSSFLCHPLRCVLTMILPTLCSKQGRKLIVSTSMMILVLNVVPNIAVNIGAVTSALRCTSEGLTRTLLNSSDSLNRAKADLVAETVKVKREDLNIVTNLKKLAHFTQVDVSEVKRRFGEMSKRIRGNFSRAEDLLKACKLLSNRILAAIFVLFLIVESARYLKSYLTSVRFDNANLSKELLQKASDSGIPMLSADVKHRIHTTTSCKITSEECPSFFIALTVVTLYFIAITFIIILDHIVYHLVQMSIPWLLDIPPTTASISVDFKVEWFPPPVCLIPQSCIRKELTSFHRDYEWTFSPQPALCHVLPSAPDVRVTVLLGFLWLASYMMVFLDVYARRIRRNISASFFKRQEDKRRDFLLTKIQAKQKRSNIYVEVVRG